MQVEPVRFSRPLHDARLIAAGAEDGQRALEAAEALAAAREAGYQQGRAEADDLRNEQLIAQRQEVLELAEGALRSLSAQQTALAAQARACIPGLVMSIVRRLLAGEELDAPRLEKTIARALAETPPEGRQPLEVSLCPADLAVLEAMGGHALPERHPRVSLRADASLARGDCMVRGAFGLIDARRETQLAAIEQLLVNS